MAYPLLLPSDLEVIETISSHLPNPGLALDFCQTIRNLNATRCSKNIPRQTLTLETPVDPALLGALSASVFNTSLKEIVEFGFPNLSQRLYNEWLTNLVLLTPTPLRQEQSKTSFLNNLKQEGEEEQPSEYDMSLIEQGCFPGDIETAESLLISLTTYKQASIEEYLSQLKQLTKERREHGEPRPVFSHENLTSVRCTKKRSALRGTLLPLVEAGFPKMVERLITEYLLEVKALSTIALKTTGLDSSDIAQNMVSRYRPLASQE